MDLDQWYTQTWEAWERGELLLHVCPSCRWTCLYPTLLCVRCGTELERDIAEGTGVIYSWTVVAPYRPDDASERLVVLVQLAEGALVMGVMAGEVPATDPLIGHPCRVVLSPRDRGVIQFELTDPGRG